ncbi:RNA 2'-phosphotransferase, Tpt1 / KptA family [Prunus dulcis]|uniref:2'-phosphotransferase n=1 Tax=Prunus dulcis TaxID=3755 RepID=A0A4Y1QZX0_PRUDU|nr:RNA 2'-phosphotransferase, Tpt1 / KptA family [Prunus dulcis]
MRGPKSHPLLLPTYPARVLMDNNSSSSGSSFARNSTSGGRGGDWDDRERSRGRGGGRGGGSGEDKIDALGRLLTRILRHMAAELNLNMRSDGYVKVQDLLKLNIQTFANIPLRSHTVDEIKEAVRKDNKQRFGLLEENGELLIRANQGHTTMIVESERLLKPILTSEEVPGMRRDVNVLIYLDVRKALEEGMKFYISENKVILTEGFDGVVPVKYFEKIESWPDRKPILF